MRWRAGKIQHALIPISRGSSQPGGWETRDWASNFSYLNLIGWIFKQSGVGDSLDQSYRWKHLQLVSVLVSWTSAVNGEKNQRRKKGTKHSKHPAGNRHGSAQHFHRHTLSIEYRNQRTSSKLKDRLQKLRKEYKNSKKNRKVSWVQYKTQLRQHAVKLKKKSCIFLQDLFTHRGRLQVIILYIQRNKSYQFSEVFMVFFP